MGMNIEFSDHAIKQQEKRKIPKSRIHDTVQYPEETITSFRGRMLNRKSYDKKTLEVVTVKEHDTIVIVTAYYIDEEES